MPPLRSRRNCPVNHVQNAVAGTNCRARHWFGRLRWLCVPLALLLLAANLAGTARADVAPAAQWYHVSGATTRTARNAIAATGAALAGGGVGGLDVLASDTQAEQIRALGFGLRPVQQLLDFPPGDEAYHNYAEMVAEIQLAQANYPAIVKLFSIGRSYEGRELWAAKISDHVASDEDEPEALFIGLYHAREHLTTEMVLQLLRLLTEGYNPAQPEAQITRLVNTRQIYLVFMLNPDGGEFDIAAPYRYWRKNRQPDAGLSFVNGTDLNRNHSYRWGGDGASSTPSDETYRGTAPGSAPETAAIERFVNSRVIDGRQRISVAISFHTYGELILWPYGYQNSDCGSPAADMWPQDRQVLQAMGVAMAATNGYTPMQSCALYTTSGDFADWAYGVHRIFAYTFEMFPGDCNTVCYGFYPPGSVIAEQTARNDAAVLYLLEHASCPYEVIGAAVIACDHYATWQRTWLPIVGR